MAGEIVGVLLAAGAGSRFGGDKLLYRLPDGLSMAVAAATHLKPACDRVVAVLRPGDDALAALLAAAGCETISCNDAQGGMGHSLAAGVRATADAAAWIVALGDMPFIKPATHQAVASCLRLGASIAASQYQGRRAHPVGFSRKWLDQLLTLTGDQGGKAILERHRDELMLSPVDDPGVIQDVDRPEDLIAIGRELRY